MAKSVFYGFEWKVKNALSTCDQTSDEFVLCESRWQLHLSLDASGYMTVSLSKLNPEKLNWRYLIRCSVEDRFKIPVCTNELVSANPDFATRIIWWIDRTRLVEKRDIYLVDGTLTFIIAFKPQNILKKDAIDQKVSDKSIQTSINMDAVADLENLSLDLQHLLDDGVQSDVTLMREKESFPAHKSILSARSKVFSAMFQSDMAESRTGVIQISDMDSSVLNQFLHYVYSGKLPDLSVDTATELYAAADKYSIESLKKLSAKFMQENLTKENACKILVLADMHADECLKDSVLCFITNGELLQNKDMWLEFHNEHPRLAGEIAFHAYEAKCHSKVN